MKSYHFFQPIAVRYGDLDPQGHVNNARFVTYLEQARVAYIRHLGLWDGRSYLEIGFIIAHLEIDYRAPILLGHPVQVGVRVSRLGEKSLTMDYRIQDPKTDRVYADATTVLVGFDYHAGRSLVIPETWREVMADFENIPRRAG